MRTISTDRILAALFAVGFALNAAAAVPSVTITVPNKSDPNFEIAVVKATVLVTAETPVTFTITHAGTGVSTNALTPGSTDCFPGSLPAGVFDLPPCGIEYSPGATGLPNSLSVVPPSAGSSGPDRRKYTFNLFLDANIDRSNLCTSGLAADDVWTISVGGGGPQIEGICVQSLDPKVGGSCNVSALRPVPLAEGVATVSGGLANIQQGCRIGLDAMLVLDRSGSMEDTADTTVPVAMQKAKITRLREAVTSFVNTWNTLRTMESGTAPIVASPTDNIGIVFFETDARWLKQVLPASTSSIGLNLFTSVSAALPGEVTSVPTAGSTTIGGGLKLAAEGFTGAGVPTNRKVILLMSDGIQNTDPRAEVVGGQVRTTNLGVPTVLANQSDLQIYSVTVGRDTAVDATINQAVAATTNGFYMNSEIDASVLPTLFMHVLQNLHRYATVETLRIASARAEPGVPFETLVPVTSTMQHLVFTITSDGAKSLRLIVQPPNGAPPIQRDFTTGGVGTTITLPVPLPFEEFHPQGDWRVAVHASGSATAGISIPFHLLVMGDDVAVNSEMGPVPADYRPGTPVIVRARVRELAKLVTGIGAKPGDRLLVQMLRPGASIGDLLSTSTASSQVPAGSDTATMSPAEAKFTNFVNTNPPALTPVQDTVTLADNGSAASGDDVAGDGIYSGRFTPEFEGHYNLLFGIEGSTQNLGRFSRQQLRTIHVKPAPDAGNTTFSSAVVSVNNGSALVVAMTPRTATNHLVGPGWGGHFWFAANGTAVRPVDNLNGTYTATIPFSGSTPPNVTVHYIDDAVKVPETTTDPSQLSVPLGPDNVLVGSVPGTGGGPGTGGSWRFFLDLGVNFPHGSFGNVAGGEWSVNAGIERMFSQAWSVEGILGYHTFELPFADPNIWQFSVNGKRFFGAGPLRPFLNGGVGLYHLDPGNSNEFGWNAGGGLLYELNATWGVEGVYNYHSVNTGGNDVEWSTVQAGFRVRF